ncbi:MAG: pyridoxamine 5'-phosphate oxidase [Gemmatimonadetes bacterium]|nr:pyridoxamine 5'-phosphate oxidase [Gemmatimonadota bacterium]
MSIFSTVRGILTMGRGVLGGLSELRAADDPIALFDDWFEAAKRAGILLPEAMTLATATPDGIPSARMVLLKSFAADGFVFYTNYGSRKAAELDANPRAALLFHWSVLHRQVRIEGTTTRTSTDESRAYFRTRPRASRVGAWASQQSEVLDSRATLEQRVREIEARHESGDDIPLPPFWGGYRLTPSRIEFWQGRANRLHDRLAYDHKAGRWSVVRLYP